MGQTSVLIGARPYAPATLTFVASDDIARGPLQATRYSSPPNKQLHLDRAPRPATNIRTAPSGHETMADSSTASPEPAGAETPAQQKARLRRERLAAKSGAARLQQISALQGGPPKSLSEIEKDVPGMYGSHACWRLWECLHLAFL